MSSKLSSATKSRAVVAPVAAVAAPAPAATIDVDDEPKKRQTYEPRSSAEFEAQITEITESIRGFKARLYPTSATKASADKAPSRREIDDVITTINGLKKDYKAQSRKAESKPKRKAPAASGKPRTGGFKNPCAVDPEIAQFIADNFNTDDLPVIDEARIVTRALLTSMFTQYAYDKNLRDNSDATKIRPDAALMALFKNDFLPAGVDPAGFPHTHMQKLLTLHVLKADKFKEHVAANNLDLEKDYKPHLESVQERFKDMKAAREASRPKIKKTKVKTAEPVAQQE